MASMKHTASLASCCLMLMLSSCMHFTTWQGNVLKPGALADIHVDDSRFHVESLLGSPVLRDVLHPNRSIYVEEYKDAESDKQYTRRVEIIYSDAGRVKSIRRYGFEDKLKKTD